MERQKTFGKIESGSTERKICRADKRQFGAEYANKRQIERLGEDKAFEMRLWSIYYSVKLRPVPYPEWLQK